MVFSGICFCFDIYLILIPYLAIFCNSFFISFGRCFPIVLIYKYLNIASLIRLLLYKNPPLITQIKGENL